MVDIHENRFVALLQHAVGESEVAQEMSIPRKSRRLDLVCRFDEAPSLFGALQRACSERTVLFEHESQPLSAHAVASAWVGLAWLSWQRIRPRSRRKIHVQRFLDGTLRPPLAIVVADVVQDDLTSAIPTLARTDMEGLWATAGAIDGGLCVIDSSRVRAEDGFAFWSWLGRARNPTEADTRLRALLADPNLTNFDKVRLEEAIMNNQIPTSTVEQETVAQRVRREGREEGRAEALRDLVQTLAPEHAAELEGIDDVDELRRAAAAILQRKH